VVYLPGYLRGNVKGLFTRAAGKLRPIHVGSNNQIRHLAAAAHVTGIAAGERFRIAFDLARRTNDLPSVPTGLEPIFLAGAE
jgi:hypothetical protein